MTDGEASFLWPILHYDDTTAARRFLVDVLGLREALVARDPDGKIMHCELRWRGRGALVLGSTEHTGGVHDGLKAGALYLVAEDAADVDAAHQRVREDGGDVVAPPHQTEFGAGIPAYAFTTRDPEGNLWTLGTYAGAV